MPRLADRSVVIKPVDPTAGQRGRCISALRYGFRVAEGQRDSYYSVILPKETRFLAKPPYRWNCLRYGSSMNELNCINSNHVHFCAVTHWVPQHQSLTTAFWPHERACFSFSCLYFIVKVRTTLTRTKVLREGADRPPRIRIENRTPPHAGKVMYIHRVLSERII